MKNLENITNTQRDEDLKLLFYGVLVGIVAGSFSSLYRYIIHGIEGILAAIINYSREHLYIYPLLFVALIFISFLVSKLKKMSKFCGGSGIPQVEQQNKRLYQSKSRKTFICKNCWRRLNCSIWFFCWS
ncbi:hypothetical protein ACP4DX_06665 [Parvimonas sp. G1604]|uniref:hypothetical protein n=1 Tax=Parvimonas sp. G1604 TaxID=3388845 RepID=UPI003D054021